MDGLREKVARECLPSWALNPIAEDWEAALAKADRILALPELKEALELSKRYFERDGVIVEKLGHTTR